MDVHCEGLVKRVHIVLSQCQINPKVLLAMEHVSYLSALMGHGSMGGWVLILKNLPPLHHAEAAEMSDGSLDENARLKTFKFHHYEFLMYTGCNMMFHCPASGRDTTVGQHGVWRCMQHTGRSWSG